MAQAHTLEQPLTMPQILRFWRRVEKTESCWLWLGAMTGAGDRSAVVNVNGKRMTARRLAWELSHPDDEPLHPKVRLLSRCHEPRCVNPDHMYPVIGGGTEPREKCLRGHDLTPENVYVTTQGKRACRECIKLKGQERRQRYLEEGRGWGRSYRAPKSTGRKV